MITIRKVCAAVFLLGCFLLALSSTMPACTGTPEQRAAKAVKVKADLCKLRALARAAEAAMPETRPVPGTARASLEAEEDALCAQDAGL